MKRTGIQFLLLLITINIFGQHSIIPEPVSYQPTRVNFIFDSTVGILFDEDLSDELLNKEYISYHLGVSQNYNDKNISFNLLDKENTDLGKEGYQLAVLSDQINISANHHSGLFNGFQTLRQLIFSSSKDDEGNPIIAGCMIEDYPRFSWRGLMLDVSRHFFTVEEVKKFLDVMAFYKLNTFHWHLTDDEGWRIEIKSFPKLTEVGAWRVERTGRFGEARAYPEPGEKATYGGYYTHDQIREVVRYAQERNITIVPEIDVPGHSMAVLAAYPELSVNNEPKFVNPGAKFAEWYGGGKFKMLIENTLNPAEEKVYDFLDKVFAEVADLFPGKYIHMGGDECYKGYWEEDDSVQKFMKNKGIKDVHELQSYFVKRVEKIISDKGKTLIGWDEILEGGLAEGATVMSWRGMSGGIEAAQMGHPVVMSPTTFCYLDYTQGDPSLENRIYASLSLRKTYDFEPIPEGVNQKLILGGQGNVWTEVIPNFDFAFYMTYPRAISLAETLWSPIQNKSWGNFIWKVEDHFDYFESQNLNISKAVYEPIVKVMKEGDALRLKLENHVPGIEIYYTTDNTYPVNFGNKYEEPIIIPDADVHLRVQSFRNGNPLGRMIILSKEELETRAK